MMESSNLNLAEQEDHFLGTSSSSSSSLALPPFTHWNQDLLLNSDPRDFMRLLSHETMPSLPQEIGLHYQEESNYMKEDLENYRLMINNNNNNNNNHVPSMGSFGAMVMPPSSPYLSSLGTDLLASTTRFGREMEGMSLMRKDLGFGLVQDQQEQHKITADQRGYDRANDMVVSEYKAPQKKPRFESRSSFAPLKVRKEKLGDRIAALQQLVAPFGKTDTASVLMEAIGYIKFLQDQVETLSVPYMKSSNTKKLRTSSEERLGEQEEEPKLDLRSRGLCLVPLSCTSYVTNENGGVWSPPNYRGS